MILDVETLAEDAVNDGLLLSQLVVEADRIERILKMPRKHLRARLLKITRIIGYLRAEVTSYHDDD